MARHIVLLFCFLPFFSQANDQVFVRSAVHQARFGGQSEINAINGILGLRESLPNNVFGQERAIRIVVDTAMTYLQSPIKTEGAPFAKHLVSSYGTGKGIIVGSLSPFIPVVTVNAEIYSDPKSITELVAFLSQNVELNSKKPVILLINEVDKAILKAARTGEASPIMGFLNSVTDNGKASSGGQFSRAEVDLSHVLLVTTQNFPPSVIEAFMKSDKKPDKAYLEWGFEEYNAFHEWLRSKGNPGNFVMGELYGPDRGDLTSRVSGNVLVLDPWTEKGFRDLIEKRIADRVAFYTGVSSKIEAGKLPIDIPTFFIGEDPRKAGGVLVAEKSNKRRLTVTYETHSLVEFFLKHTVDPPNGARPTEAAVEQLISQLISFGERLTFPELPQQGLDRPRKIHITVQGDTVSLTVTPRKLISEKGNRTLADMESRSMEIEFDVLDRIFHTPKELYSTQIQTVPVSDRLTPTMIKEARYPKLMKKLDGLPEKIGEKVFGQEELIADLMEDVTRYLRQQGGAEREPITRILAGFTGVGKSRVLEVLADALGIPFKSVNLQAFTSQNEDAAKNLLDTLESEVRKLRSAAQAAGHGKFILVVEEMDKAPERDISGMELDRPVLTIIKDILDKGRAEMSIKGDFGMSVSREIDVRDGLIFGTMNFPRANFDITADPRITTIADMMGIYYELKRSHAGLFSLLRKSFLDDTVGRYLTKMLVVPPPTAEAYEKIILEQVDKIKREAFRDASGKNILQIELSLEPGYLRYLFAETVIPALGGRYTAENSRKLIMRDINNVIDGIRQGKLHSAPLSISLDFEPRERSVIGKIKAQSPIAEVRSEVVSHQVNLRFPDLTSYDGKVGKNIMLTSVRKLGQALTAARLGLRIQTISVHSPQPGVDGFVKLQTRGHEAGRFYLARIFHLLGGRAMDRVINSSTPLEARSVIDTHAFDGQSDIKAATKALFTFGYKQGFIPELGNFDRQGGKVEKCCKYIDVIDLQADEIEKLTRVLTAMEQFLVEDLVRGENPRIPYTEFAKEIALRGSLGERSFYEMIQKTPPFPDASFLGRSSKVESQFADVIYPTEHAETRKARIGNIFSMTGETAEQRMDRYVEAFAKITASVYGSPENAKPLEVSTRAQTKNISIEQVMCGSFL